MTTINQNQEPDFTVLVKVVLGWIAFVVIMYVIFSEIVK